MDSFNLSQRECCKERNAVPRPASNRSNQCVLICRQIIRAGIPRKQRGAGLHPHSVMYVCPFTHVPSRSGWS
jgi:hypothetical protein